MADIQQLTNFIAEATSKDLELIDRVVACYPGISMESREVNEIITMLLDDEVETFAWLLRHERIPEPYFECLICLDQFKVTEMYTLSCDSAHRFCYDCTTEHVKLKLKEKTFITCPAAKCDYQLTPADLKDLKVPTREITNYDEWLSLKTIVNTKAVACPGKDCKVFIYPSDESICEPCPCTNCKIDFCSKCKREYHWRSDCAEVPNIEQRWVAWCFTGRQQRSQTKTMTQRNMVEYTRAKLIHAKLNEELKQRYQELSQDEEYKRHNCKRCPNCARVVQKLGGCDAMKCGTDYHGGNVQNGCGAVFNWSAAHAYVPSAAAVKQDEFKMPEPKAMELVKHEYYKCDECQNDITGLRFSCLNCKAYDVCEDCDMAGRSVHKRNHVFKIYHK